MITLPEDFMQTITWKQREVLALLMKGMTTDAICETMCLAEPTVKMHLTGLLKAAGAENRVQLVVAALNVEIQRLQAGQDERAALTELVGFLRGKLAQEKRAREVAEATLRGAMQMAGAMGAGEQRYAVTEGEPKEAVDAAE